MEGPFTTTAGVVVRPKHFAGRTLDLTLFAVMRALDVIVGELWTQRKDHRQAAGKWTKVIVLVVEYKYTLTKYTG